MYMSLCLNENKVWFNFFKILRNDTSFGKSGGSFTKRKCVFTDICIIFLSKQPRIKLQPMDRDAYTIKNYMPIKLYGNTSYVTFVSNSDARYNTKENFHGTLPGLFSCPLNLN